MLVLTAKFCGHPNPGGIFHSNWANHNMPIPSLEINIPTCPVRSNPASFDFRNNLILNLLSINPRQKVFSLYETTENHFSRWVIEFSIVWR
jgi:hypothetical protein